MTEQQPKSTDPEQRPASESEQADPTEQPSIRGRLRQLEAATLLRRYGRYAAIGLVLVVGVVAARVGLDRLPLATQTPAITEESLQPTATVVRALLSIADLPPYEPGGSSVGVQPQLDIHTVIPSRPRLEVITYEVEQGDSLFGIADQYGLTPETILWGNYDILEDNPHALAPGQQINILPVNGTYYQWHEGDTLTGVADFFNVEPQEILDWPGNNLDPAMDYEAPSIEAGTWIVVPEGEREFVSWQAPRVSRTNPAAARVLGPGFCGQIVDGAIGGGTFVWPTPGQSVSGYGYSSYHPAIDIGGSTGNAIYASDNGVVVYAGWNDYGYGNLVILDHGNGWQTLYAHLNSFNVGCGDSVFQSQVVAGMGCTGNCTGTHLHFEMQSDVYGKVNPVNFLP